MGKPDTDDDLEIGRVNATWSLEEYGVTYDDDDVKFVGSVDQTRTLHAEPRRSESAAQLQPQQHRRRVGRRDVSSRPARPRGRSSARAQLIVTVPLYVKFAPWKTQP